MDNCRFLLVVSLLCCALVSVQAELSEAEKQLLLDLHNSYRAQVNAADMRRLVSLALVT